MVLVVRADENRHRGIVIGRGAVLGDDMAHRMPVRAEDRAAEAPVVILVAPRMEHLVDGLVRHFLHRMTAIVGDDVIVPSDLKLRIIVRFGMA